MEAIVGQNCNILPSEVLQARCPPVTPVRIEQHIGEPVIGAMAWGDLLYSSLSQVQDDVHLLASLSRQDRSHLEQSTLKSFLCLK